MIEKSEAGLAAEANEALVLDVGRVGELERAVEASGTSLAELMGRAGAAVADAVRRAQPACGRVVVLAGSGNNGGDGWVAARVLAEAGWDVVIACTKPADEVHAEPARTTARKVADWACSAAGEGRLLVREAPDEREVAALLLGADAAVDALLGTGFSGSELRDPYGKWVLAMNRAHDAGVYVVAADVPSGLSAQTGAAASPFVVADETVTMLALKPGLLVEGAKPITGALSCAPLGIDIVRDFPSFAKDAASKESDAR